MIDSDTRKFHQTLFNLRSETAKKKPPACLPPEESYHGIRLLALKQFERQGATYEPVVQDASLRLRGLRSLLARLCSEHFDILQKSDSMVCILISGNPRNDTVQKIREMVDTLSRDAKVERGKAEIQDFANEFDKNILCREELKKLADISYRENGNFIVSDEDLETLSALAKVKIVAYETEKRRRSFLATIDACEFIIGKFPIPTYKKRRTDIYIAIQESADAGDSDDHLIERQ